MPLAPPSLFVPVSTVVADTHEIEMPEAPAVEEAVAGPPVLPPNNTLVSAASDDTTVGAEQAQAVVVAPMPFLTVSSLHLLALL